ncbi:hypothetical protein [Novosphingobium sp. BL-52-GroH]|uniref:hypothetical protein n=1 Tax=Novosphingobium sp. BL-52-GroH TaxID=3349877 RepID=UPI00384F43FC
MRFADAGEALLRTRRGAPASSGRQWEACPRTSDRCRRRDEVSRLAFLLLGGPQAARDFLQHPRSGFTDTPLATAMRSSLGQLQVSLQIRRSAAMAYSPFPS